MRRRMLIALVLVLTLAGCSAKPVQDETAAQARTAAAGGTPAATARNTVQIREKMFISQVNDVYLNPDDYMGKTIVYEGVFDCYPYNAAGDMFYSVIRYGPGCCGNDGNVGFEVIWNKDYPKRNDWVSVEGNLEAYDEDGETYLRLRCTKLDVMAERGNETVSQ